MKGTGAGILVKYLEQEGVKYVFGIPGGHLLTFYDELLDSSITPILTKHEGGASYMAAGYALVSGNIGVCCGTVGPGATNLVSGVAAAYMASLPMLVITAQVGTPAIGKGAVQEAAGEGRTLSQRDLFSSLTKHATVVTHASRMPEAVRQALRIAQSGRPGPVHLDLPADAQRGAAKDSIVPSSSYRPSLHTTPLAEDVAKAADLLVRADKPGILAGGGSRRGLGPQHLLRLAELLSCPVATSLPGKGAIPEDHPLALGCIGLYGTTAANTYMRSGLDVMLAVGTSLNEATTHVWDPALQPSLGLIQIDVDPEEIGKNYEVAVGLLGEAEVVLEALCREVEARAPRGRTGERLAELKKRTMYFDEPAMSSTSVPLKPQRVMAELREAVPDDAMLFTDIGNNLIWVERDFVARRPDTTFSLSGLAGMGSGVAAVVGGKLAAPERPALVVCGDGDFQMHGMEVMTAVSYKIPVVWLILENGRLDMIHDAQTMAYRGRYIATDFATPDFVKLAEAFGIPGYRASKPGEVRDMVGAALGEEGPAIVTVPIDREEMPPTRARMMALERVLGNPPWYRSISKGGFRAVLSMRRER